jgi:hypothetical protein
MGNHPFNVIVILFWLAAMSWLVVAKIVPPLRVGEPPNYASILEQGVDQPPVCWSIRMHDRAIGWAANKVVRRKDGITELYSRVYLGQFPWDDIAPGWLENVLKPMLSNFREMDVDKKSKLVVDPLGRLVGFESRVRVGNLPNAIKVSGQMEGSILKLSLQSGEFSHKGDHYLPPNALTSDELSPQANMPGLSVGQTWTVPLYSPFRSPNSPMEILQATVDRQDQLTWNGKSVKAHVIIYRDDPGSGLTSSEPRGRVWVRDDGVVLRQEVAIFRSHVHFVRLSEDRAEEIWRALGPDWNDALPAPVAKQLLEQLRDEAP